VREKKKFVGIVIFSVIVLIVTGTFAWSSFSSQTISLWFGEGAGSIAGSTDSGNQGTGDPGSGTPVAGPRESEPGGTLHDYHSEDGEYKQTHIENWGSEPLFVRIRLDEYMEMGSGAGLCSIATDGNTGESIANPQNLAKPLVNGTNIDDPRTWEPHAPVDDSANVCEAGFHDFWEWEMGGQKYYFPAAEEHRTNKSFVDTNSPPDLTSDSVNEAGVQARQTRLAQVLTMAQWRMDGSPVGDFWVIDTDGWSYWAAPLNPGESTGLLLNKITQVTQPEEDYFYGINVIAQMATRDLDDFDNYMRFGDEENGGWTEDGQALIERIVNHHIGSDISIIVHTPFPSGTIIDNIVDVTYTATPGTGSIITEVSYLINSHAEELLYLAGVDGITPRGILGEGRVLLVPGYNEIVFTVRDSAGNTANYTVYQRPYYEFGTIPRIDMAFVEQMSSAQGVSFVSNRVIAVANPGVNMEEVNSAAESIGGRISGQVNLLRWHIIEVDSQTEDGLLDICAELMATGLFSRVSLDMIYRAGTNTAPTDDPWWGNGNQWGLDAISVPQAWRDYGHLMNEITLGIVDDGVRYTHMDLLIPRENIRSAHAPGHTNQSSTSCS